MLRLTILYHDDTREPVAVEHGVEYQMPAGCWPMPDSSAKVSTSTDGIRITVAHGPKGPDCRELLLRERRHWETALEAEAAKEGAK